MVEQLIFYSFAGLAILSSLMVVFASNPVRSVLFLVLSFFAMAGIWVMLEAEFLAVALVLVYVGAVMVLFLFVVMMLDVEMGAVKLAIKRHTPLGVLVLGLLIAILGFALGKQRFGADVIAIPAPSDASYNNIEALGELLYTQYLLPFEVAGVLLLVAMIAAISLAFRGRRSKRQNPTQQIHTTKSDRLEIIKMPAQTKDSL